MTIDHLKPATPNKDAPSSILFVCSMNAVRSPMAAAITRTLYPHIIYTRSAGIEKGENDPFVKAVMNELGIDISTHYPHTFTELNDGNFDLTITLSQEAKQQAEDIMATNGSVMEFWPTEDPTLTSGKREQVLDAYRAVRDTLIERILERFSG